MCRPFFFFFFGLHLILGEKSDWSSHLLAENRNKLWCPERFGGPASTFVPPGKISLWGPDNKYRILIDCCIVVNFAFYNFFFGNKHIKQSLTDFFQLNCKCNYILFAKDLQKKGLLRNIYGFSGRNRVISKKKRSSPKFLRFFRPKSSDHQFK